jgi:hypothetical protein
MLFGFAGHLFAQTPTYYTGTVQFKLTSCQPAAQKIQVACVTTFYVSSQATASSLSGPIQDAEISIYANSSLVGTYYTDATGYAYITGLATGTYYDYIVSASNYVSSQENRVLTCQYLGVSLALSTGSTPAKQ